MKTLYLICGTMGVGKTTVGRQLMQDLPNSVFLDGDWCWYSSPFKVTEETKAMATDNICHMLNNFLHCSAYENIIFCWVMHRQSIIDAIVERLDTCNSRVKVVCLIADERSLRARLSADIKRGVRTADIIDRSVAKIPLYRSLNAIQIDTSGKTVRMIAEEIKQSTF